MIHLFHKLSIPDNRSTLTQALYLPAAPDDPVQHLPRPERHPPPLRGRGVLLLQGLLQARHREALLLRGGHRGLHHRPQQQAELPVVQV